MTFIEAVKLCLFDRCFQIHGRAGRAEFWRFFIVAAVILPPCIILHVMPLIGDDRYRRLFGFELSDLYVSIPFYIMSYTWWLLLWFACAFTSVMIRRLHDINFSAFCCVYPVLLGGGYYVFVPMAVGWMPYDELFFQSLSAALVFALIPLLFRGTAGKNSYGEPVSHNREDIFSVRTERKISFFAATVRCFFRKALCISGRASPAEYWKYFFFIWSIRNIVLIFIPYHFWEEYLIVLQAIQLWFIVTLFTVSVRRFHDLNKRGYFAAVYFLYCLVWWSRAFISIDNEIFYIFSWADIPLFIIMCFYMGQPGTEGDNSFGKYMYLSAEYESASTYKSDKETAVFKSYKDRFSDLYKSRTQSRPERTSFTGDEVREEEKY